MSQSSTLSDTPAPPTFHIPSAQTGTQQRSMSAADWALPGIRGPLGYGHDEQPAAQSQPPAQAQPKAEAQPISGSLASGYVKPRAGRAGTTVNPNSAPLSPLSRPGPPPLLFSSAARGPSASIVSQMSVASDISDTPSAPGFHRSNSPPSSPAHQVRLHSRPAQNMPVIPIYAPKPAPSQSTWGTNSAVQIEMTEQQESEKDEVASAYNGSSWSPPASPNHSHSPRPAGASHARFPSKLPRVESDVAKQTGKFHGVSAQGQLPRHGGRGSCCVRCCAGSGSGATSASCACSRGCMFLHAFNS